MGWNCGFDDDHEEKNDKQLQLKIKEIEIIFQKKMKM